MTASGAATPPFPACDLRGGRAADERRRLLAAVADLARERNGRGLVIRRVCARAGLSPEAFPDHFSDAEDCFASAIEDALAQIWAAVEERRRQVDPAWEHQVAAAIGGFLGALHADLDRAWMSIVEPLGGSARVRDARQATIDRFVALLGDGPVARDDVDRTPASTAAGTVGGLWEMARQSVIGGPDAVGPEDVAGSSIFLALAPYVGREAAMAHAFTARVAVAA